MYCSNCGKEIADSAISCPECGTQVKSADYQPYNAGSDRNGAGANANYNTMCIIGAVVSGISLLVPLCGIGGFILSRMGAKQVAESGERGKELALAGTVVGGITAVYTIIMLLISFGALLSIKSLF